MILQKRIKQILAAIAILFITAVVLVWAFESQKIGKMLNERRNEKQTILEKTIELSGKSLADQAFDYTYWDEMVRFVSTGDKRWGRDNIDASYKNFGGNISWVLKPDFSLVYFSALNPNVTFEETGMGDERIHSFIASKKFGKFYINTKAGIYEMWMAPIQPGNDLERKTPALGYFFVGRMLDSTVLDRLSLLNSSKIFLSTYKTKDTYPHENRMYSIANKLPLRGMDNNPLAVLVSVSDFKLAYQASRGYYMQFAIIIIVLILAFAIIAYFLLKYVKNPLAIISRSLQEGNAEFLSSIENSKSEFGRIAYLIHKFFEQRAALQKSLVEREEINELLAESEHKLRTILDAVPDQMSRCNRAGDFLDYSVSSHSLFKLEREQIINKNVRELFGNTALFPADLPDMIMTSIAECLDKSDMKVVEYRIDYPGDVRYFEVRIVPFAEDEVLGITREITKRKNAELAFASEKIKAEEASRFKSSMLLNISHELRTPMNGILGLTEILMNEVEDEEHKKLTQMIKSAGRRLMFTLNSIINLSDLESNNFNIKPDKVDISESILKIIPQYQASAAEKNLTLRFLNNTGRVICNTDRGMLERAFENILDNAVKYTLNGSVKVELDVHTEKNVDYAEIKVTDTGIGIDENEQEYIFDAFRQASEGQDRNYEGTGLGLTIAYKLIALLGGEIKLSSKAGSGSSFSIILPADMIVETGVITGEIQEEHKTDDEKETGENFTILLVEDNEANALVVRLFLRNEYEVDHAADGMSAVEMAGGKKYSLILMDINLGPGIDGVTATEEIRKISGYETTPIVALTGYAMHSDKDRFLASGLTHYLAKPFESHQLKKLINEVINKQ